METPDADTAIQVAAAVLQQAVARSMSTLAVRRSDGPMRGYWELPGGKREPGETLLSCLTREIKEELGLLIEVGDCLGSNRCKVNEKTIELHAFFVLHWTGTIKLTVHDELRWLGTGEPDAVKWSPADVPLIEQLKHCVVAAN